MSNDKYSDSVFINCPFDDCYKIMLEAIVFATFDCGFIPRSALELEDSAEVRINKIQNIIKESKYGIHDISRTELCKRTDLPRFNMPFELGLFLGAKKFGGKKQREKRCLILDVEKYRFQTFISDIAGQDIRSHNNSEESAIKETRNWLSSVTKRRIPGGKEIFRRYKEFRGELPELCKEAKIDTDELTYNDYANFVEEWLSISLVP